METSKDVQGILLTRRKSDGKFLRLHDDGICTDYKFVDSPLEATIKEPTDIYDWQYPHKASYYYENSDRARDYWIKGCDMVSYTIITERVACGAE